MPTDGIACLHLGYESRQALLPVLLLAAAGYLLLGPVPDFSKKEAGPAVTLPEASRPFRYRGSYNDDFNDLNARQLEAAVRIGITPCETRAELKKEPKLVPVAESSTLSIDRLTHSQALLVPEAAALLDEIGRTFTGVLEREGEPLYAVIVTSVTRTDEDIRKLRKGNPNATENSTHAYGTTFDLSWRRFHKTDLLDPRSIEPEELKALLATVLGQFHDQGRCYVKHERLQACFHVTTIR